MTLYLLVVGLITCGPYTERTKAVPCEPMSPNVGFFLGQDTAAKAYAATPKGSARLFKIKILPWGSCEYQPVGKYSNPRCARVDELNVLPAQSYEISDKDSIEVNQ